MIGVMEPEQGTWSRRDTVGVELSVLVVRAGNPSQLGLDDGHRTPFRGPRELDGRALDSAPAALLAAAYANTAAGTR